MRTEIDPATLEIPASPTVRKAFTGGGKAYAPGDVFPWRALGVPESRVRGLFRTRHLTLDPPEAFAHLRKNPDTTTTPPPHRRKTSED